MNKKILSVALLALLVGTCASFANSISWGVELASAFTWFDHNGVAMDGTPSGSSYLIQLIYAGNDGIDPINMVDTDGTGGNDVMVAFGKFGNGLAPRTDGKIEAVYNNGAPNTVYANNSWFYMRAWEVVSAGGGSVTSAGGVAAQWYGNSMMFQVHGQNIDPLAEQDDRFYATADLGGASGQYAMQAVPEPTTVALLGLGLAIVALRRRAA